MWTNKPTAGTPNSGAPPESNDGVDLQAPGRESTRGGVAGGLRIVGEIKGREDLFIAGEVSGSVFLPECGIHVGPNADVNANMTARVIDIEGTVTGDLVASERIAVRSSSTVTGDIVAPQIQIDEGCRFKGSVQMREPDVKRKRPAKSRLAAGEGAIRYKAANE